MAISLTTDGLRLDYRTKIQTYAEKVQNGVGELPSGTYPIGTVVVVEAYDGNNVSLPGIWSMNRVFWPWIGSDFVTPSLAVRVK